MVARLPDSKREAIKQRLHEKKSHIAIAEETSASIQTVKNYSSNLKHYGVVLLPSISKRGRPPKMMREMVEVCVSKGQWVSMLLTISIGFESIYWRKTPCLSGGNGWFHRRGVRYWCFPCYNQQNPSKRKDITEKGTGFPTLFYHFLLLILVAKDCKRTFPITS